MSPPSEGREAKAPHGICRWGAGTEAAVPSPKDRLTRRRLTIIAVVLLLGTFATSAMAAGNATQWKTAPRVSAKTLIQSVDRRAPQVPPSLSVSAVSTTGISLTWGASRDNVGVAGYGVYLNGTRLASTTARSYTLSGLKCGTTYKVGVDAFDATRNRSGIASVLAATAPCVDATAPTAPASLHQSGWSQTGLAVEWSESSDNVGVAGYSIYRNGVPIAVTQQRSAWVVGLVCGAGYSVSVDAYDAAGNHSPRATAVANTTACADTSPPGAPHNLRVSGSTESAISVAWDAPVDDVGVAEYRLSVNDVDMRTTTATTATFTGLACGRSYVVKVVAADAAGNVSPSASVIAPTAVCPTSGGSADTQAPTTPSSLVRLDGTSTSLTLSWKPSTDNVGVAGYGIYRGTAKVADSNVTAYGLEGLTCGTSYTLSVDAVDVSGLRSGRATIVTATEPCQDTTPPSAPTGLASPARTETSVTLSWQASTDAGGVAGYRVYRDGALAGSTGSTSYTVAGLTCGKSYTFSVEAYDASGNHSARPATIVSTVACSDTVAPSAPTSFVKTGATTTSIAVSWSAASDNVAVAGYSLFVAGSAIGTTGQSSYTFSGLSCGTSYALGIEAYDAAGNRSPRITLQADAAACASSPPPPQSNGSTANLFVVASGGSSGCVRSASLRTYSEAVAATPTNVCNTFDTACSAATAGDIVGVKNGNYAIDDAGRNAILMDNGDCSDGAGANTNPNGPSIPSNWVSFQCADGASTPRSVEFPAGNFDIHAKLHAEFKGRCFWINHIHGGDGGDSTLTAQYVRFDDVQILGFDCSGCQDFSFLNSESGPGIFCYATGSPQPDAKECKSTGPYWEAKYATRGTSDLSGMEMYLHQNSGAVGAANISFINHYAHDIQTKNTTNAASGLLADGEADGAADRQVEV